MGFVFFVVGALVPFCSRLVYSRVLSLSIEIFFLPIKKNKRSQVL